MKSIAILTVSAALSLMAAEIHAPQPDGLTVHEWGTFTSVAGEDGSAVYWDTLGCKSDLPAFVNTFGFPGFKFQLHGTVRMETPVMYFYSARELDAHVKVAFPQGLITEWYPRAKYEIYQKLTDGSTRILPANLNGFDTSMASLTGAIEWKNVKVQPESAPALRVDGDSSRYYAARATDAAPIQVGDQHEKFLFYRGVGSFAVPLSARLAAGGKVIVENQTSNPVPSVILFESRGGRLGYRNAGAVSGGVTIDPPALDASFEQLRHDLEAALIAQGLFPKEAQAMVETWRDSWFEEGSRLIYIVPARSVDAILPLQVDPAPVATSRVFVGRIELITPATENVVKDALAKNDWAAVNRNSRFLDPILKRIYAAYPYKVSEIEQAHRMHQGPCR
jgi:hypothetical protein